VLSILITTVYYTACSLNNKQLQCSSVHSRGSLLFCAGFGGIRLWAPRVIIVATHSDVAGSENEKTRDLLKEIIQTYSADLVIEKHLFILDSNQAMGSEMKLLRQTISDIKKFICEVYFYR
jgi:hypothetical protein